MITDIAGSSAIFTFKGIVIAERFLGEADKFIDILTDAYGVVEVFVKGARRLSSRLLSGTQVFCYANFCVEKKRRGYTLDSVEIIHSFHAVGKEPSAMALAYYIAEVIRFTVLEGKESAKGFNEILPLVLNTLGFLEKSQRPQPVLKAIFELRLLSCVGMMPNLVCCADCGEYLADLMYLLYDEGLLKCTHCFNGNVNTGSVLAMEPALLHTARYIIFSDFKKLWSFRLVESMEKKLENLSETYFLRHIGKQFKTLAFWKSVSF